MDFDNEARILGKMYEVAVRTGERVQMPLAVDFACDPTNAPEWSKAVDFDHLIKLPSGEAVKGLRFMDFKDCTNHYLVTSKNEAKSFFGMSAGDQQFLLTYMDGK